GELVRTVGGGLPKSAALAVSPDGKQLATIGMEPVEGSALPEAARPEKIRVWDLAGGKLVRELDWGKESFVIHHMFPSFSADGNSVIVVNEVASDHVEMKRWRVSDGELIRRWTLSGPTPDLRAVAFDPAGKTVAFGTENGMVRLFDLDTGKETTPA